MDEISIGDVTLTKYAMLYIEDYELAVVADLHIGYEDVMASQGLFLPKFQKKHILKVLNDIYEKYAPKTLVVNGDFKHEFSRNMAQEWKEVEEVLDFMISNGNVVVIRGNHDNFLSAILRKKGIILRDSFSIGKFRFAHGHLDVSIEGTTIIGHEHPGITLRDELSATLKLPCFLYSEDLIVIPALSIYAFGTDLSKKEFISPILRKNKRDFEVFGIDEKMGIVPLGRLTRLLHSEVHLPLY